MSGSAGGEEKSRCVMAEFGSAGGSHHDLADALRYSVRNELDRLYL